jgi:tellurite resistance protein TehA-like permease
VTDVLGAFWAFTQSESILLVAAILLFALYAAFKAGAKRAGSRWGIYGVLGMVVVAGAVGIWFSSTPGVVDLGWFLLGFGLLFLVIAIVAAPRGRGR